MVSSQHGPTCLFGHLCILLLLLGFILSVHRNKNGRIFVGQYRDWINAKERRKLFYYTDLTTQLVNLCSKKNFGSVFKSCLKGFSLGIWFSWIQSKMSSLVVW